MAFESLSDRFQHVFKKLRGQTRLSESNMDEMLKEIAVIETGLGGRLDSTNIITPRLSIITSIGLDHCALLGVLEDIDPRYPELPRSAREHLANCRSALTDGPAADVDR